MKKVTAGFLLACITSSAGAAQTQIEFGPYLNCIVVNDASFPILITRTDYVVTGALGPASSSFQCASGCIVPPGGTTKMTGPANDPRIVSATCSVVFRPN